MNDIEDLVKIITQKVIEKLNNSQISKLDNSSEINVYGNETNSLKLFLKKYGYVASFQKQRELDIVITNLSLESLIRISYMIPSTEEESEILKGLLSSKKVFILNDGRGYNSILKKSPYVAKQHILHCEKQLVRFGAKFVSNNFTDYSKKNNKVLTKLDLENRYKESKFELKVNNNTIITPLAEDFIREKNLNIIVVREEG